MTLVPDSLLYPCWCSLPVGDVKVDAFYVEFLIFQRRVRLPWSRRTVGENEKKNDWIEWMNHEWYKIGVFFLWLPFLSLCWTIGATSFWNSNGINLIIYTSCASILERSLPWTDHSTPKIRLFRAALVSRFQTCRACLLHSNISPWTTCFLSMDLMFTFLFALRSFVVMFLIVRIFMLFRPGLFKSCLLFHVKNNWN